MGNRTLTIATAALLLFGIQSGTAFAGKAAALKQERKQARNLIDRAVNVTPLPPTYGETEFRDGFNRALALTRPELSESRREEGFYLASRCLHPNLFAEVRPAIETYLKLFPKGRNRMKVLVNLALLEYAEGRPAEAQIALQDALALAKGRDRLRVQNLQLNGLFHSNHFRSAETWLQERGEEGKTQPNPKRAPFMRHQRWFERGSNVVSEAMKTVAEGKISEETAIATLRKAIDIGWFAPEAPEAALLVLAKEDASLPQPNGQEVDLFDLYRTSIHRLPALRRTQRLEAFLLAYPEADEELRGRVMLQLRGIALHEDRDRDSAAYWLKKLEELPSFAQRVEAERAGEELLQCELEHARTAELLRKLLEMPGVLPYDNGFLPVLDTSTLQKWLVYSELMRSDTRNASSLLPNLQFQGKVRSIPEKIVLWLAANNKDQAWAEFKNVEKSLSSKDRLLLKDFLFPLYKDVKERDRLFLTALAMSERFPAKAIDLLLLNLICAEPIRTSQHSLALLAELYQRHQGYVEGQATWNQLRKLYPSSRWLR